WKMPRAFPWLPIGQPISPGTSIGPVIEEGIGYQLIRGREAKAVILLARRASLLGSAIVDLRHGDSVPITQPLEFDGERYLIGIFALDDAPMRIGNLPARASPITAEEATSLSCALAALQDRQPNAAWADALFLPSLRLCVPTTATPDKDRRLLAVRLL